MLFGIIKTATRHRTASVVIVFPLVCLVGVAVGVARLSHGHAKASENFSVRRSAVTVTDPMGRA